MNIPSTILDGINQDIRALLTEAAIAHIKGDRRATVTLRLTVKRDRESGKRMVVVRVSGSIPEGEEDSRTVKRPQEVLLSVADDHPGQMRIDASNSVLDGSAPSNTATGCDRPREPGASS